MCRSMAMTCFLILWAASLPAQEKSKPTEAQDVKPDSEPTAVDKKAQVTAKIARWYDSKKAAISLRFDDSHPSHILLAVPLLTQYGMVGTFFINPGRDAYRKYKEKWETQAIQGGARICESHHAPSRRKG